MGLGVLLVLAGGRVGASVEEVHHRGGEADEEDAAEDGRPGQGDHLHLSVRLTFITAEQIPLISVSFEMGHSV